MPLNIAIDGPVGAGKSSIASLVAQELRILHLDTGAMYRAVGLYMLRRGVDPQDEAAVSAPLPGCRVDVRYEDGSQRTLLCGEDVTGMIRTPEVSQAASAISQWPDVRSEMVDMQRRIAAGCDLIMDGRDIGTTVFPDAELKIFVTATPEIRAQRRYDELKAKGEEASFDEILENVKQRDYIDQNRDVSPLRKASDALLLDNSHLSISQQKEWLAEQFERVIKEKN